MEVWVCDSWYLGVVLRCGYVIVGIWAFGLLEEGGADFCLFYDDFSVLS